MEESQTRERLDIFSPLFVTAVILAFAKDIACLFLLGVAVPVIGQVIAVCVLSFTAFVAIFFAFAILGKLEHFVPKLILCAGVLPIPIPGFTVGIFILAVAAQNRLIELAITQVAIQAVAVATGGAGEALEAGALAEGGAATALEGGGAAVISGAKTIEGTAEAAGGAQKLRGVQKAGKTLERGLRAHERNLREELGTEEGENTEEGPTAEEVFGLEEPTEQFREGLFEPEYKTERAEEGAENNEIAARQKFEAQKQKERDIRRAAEYEEEEPGLVPIPKPPIPVVASPTRNEVSNEVELDQAA